MIIDSGFLNEWQHKGHCYGECMSHTLSDLMYVYIPKNASSWTKPNLKDWGWQFYNYRTDNLNKTAIVVLRDPVERWLSGIAEYFSLYHNHINVPNHNPNLLSIIFDKITFDDHTEKQVKFIHGLNTDECIFLWCDDRYGTNFSKLIQQHLGPNKYDQYEYQHVSEFDRNRRYYKTIFQKLLDDNPQYLEKVKQHFAEDYKLIKQVKFYG